MSSFILLCNNIVHFYFIWETAVLKNFTHCFRQSNMGLHPKVDDAYALSIMWLELKFLWLSCFYIHSRIIYIKESKLLPAVV